MVRFWDTSAVIPLCLDEARSSQVTALFANDSELAVWWGTVVETHSVFGRLVRIGSLDAPQRAEAQGQLANLEAAWFEVPPTDELRSTAQQMLYRHPLRAADALQLAAALMWCESRTMGAGFVSLDMRLRKAAQREGFSVLPNLPDETA